VSKMSGPNRRSFLKSTAVTALSGTALSGAAGSSFAATARPKGSLRLPNGKFDFDSVYSRIGTDCYKWDDQVSRFGADKFKVGMGVASMDFQAAPCVTEALAKRCAHENWGYTVIQDSFYEAIADWNKDRHGLDVDPDSIVISAGVYPGIIAALRTISEPASKVLLMTPAYSGFYFHISHTHTVPNESLMTFKNGRYKIDWADLESRMTPDTQALILCNPHNPTGNVWSKKDLLRLGRLCLANQVVVLADEIHCDLIRSGETYTPFASLPDKAVVANSVTFKALSKTFSLAAMKNAYFFATDPVLLERIKLNHRPDISVLGITANEAAYREGAEWLDQLLVYLDDNHSFVADYIDNHLPLIKYTKAQGTYLSWLDVSQVMSAVDLKKVVAFDSNGDYPATPEEQMEQWFVTHAGVQLNPGSKYGLGGAGHMRMNLGTSRKLIKVALDNIAGALRRLT